jgi:hypothetical protein
VAVAGLILAVISSTAFVSVAGSNDQAAASTPSTTPPTISSPITVTSFGLSLAFELPAGPGIILVLKNSGISLITRLSASLYIRVGYTLTFPNVSQTSPLEPGQSASASEVLLDGFIVCGQDYQLNITGTTSMDDSGFALQTILPLTC